ncbi:G2/M phase-specific E3 ubiquitin-protein ligase-like [Erpetoichthys calabaricus]|uniref:G2/M phase-specific E3 ubiquitin-protein ligase-like n=1 Tax=Erpetoichthys calabaricus TaxID=27687 RepID=UPI002234C4C4|nr:G2/M phase-specific E3 ubiquitin-protein ligase-like [Erpetoichthys calabaricus]
MEAILNSLSKSLNREEVVRFNIMRKNVWDGTKRAMTRANFSPYKRIDVKFTDDLGVSEGAVDLGGPKREFFRLVLLYLKEESGIFEGPDEAKILSCNTEALKASTYFHAGQILAMTVVHGGPPPCFLSKVLYEALIKGPTDVRVNIDHVFDQEVHGQLKAINDATTDEDLSNSVELAASILSLSGCFKKVDHHNKGDVVLDVAHWYVFQRTRSNFESFKEGLGALEILEAIQHHPEVLKSVFTNTGKKLTASDVENLFTVSMSEIGSNRFQRESCTVGFWRDYLQDAEFDPEAVSLEDLLIFITGSDKIPPLGFCPTPCLEFLHDGSRFPLANTCDNVIRIPFKQSFSEFKSDMDFGIKNSPGFGTA